MYTAISTPPQSSANDQLTHPSRRRAREKRQRDEQ